MIQITSCQPILAAGLPTSTSEFPPLPSISIDTVLVNPNLLKEISFADSLNQVAQLNHESLRRDITMVGGIPQIK